MLIRFCYFSYKTVIAQEKMTSFNCEFCENTFSKNDILKWHQSTVHENQRNFKCGHCEKRFPSKTFLQRHLLTAHIKFECGLCEKSYSKKEQLKKNFN